MGIIIRQSAISSILSYIGVGIGYINLLYLFPKYMSPEEVGLARIIQDAALIMVPFAQLGVSQLIIRYFPEYRKKDHYGQFISLILGFLIISLSLFTIVYLVFQSPIAEYFSQQSPDVIQYLYYIMALLFILALYQTMVSLCQSSLNIVLPNFLKEVLLRALTMTGILLFAFQVISFSEFVFLLLGAYLLNLVILIIYLVSKGVLKMQFSLQSIDGAIIKQMISYALFTFLGASGILIIGKVDSLMVTGMLGLRETAIYTTAFYIAVLIELPKRAVAQIGMPIISRAFESNNHLEISKIYKQSSINNLVMGSLIFIGLWINLENIFTLIPRTEIYSLGSLVVLIVGAGKLFDMAAGLNGEIIIMSKYYRVNVYLIVGLAIITIIANYIFIPIYGINGAAIGSAIALVLFNTSKYLFLQIKFNFQPFSVNTIKVVVIGTITAMIGIWLPKLDNTYLDILYRSGIVTIFYSLMVYFFRVSEEINDQVKRLFS